MTESEPLPRPASEALRLERQAEAAHRSKQWERALAFWDLRLNTCSERSTARCYEGKGQALTRLQRYAEAFDAFRQLLRLYPEDPRGHVGLAQALMEARELASAAHTWAECIRRFPNEVKPEWYLKKATSWLRLKQYDKALAGFEEFLRLQPDHREARRAVERVKIHRAAAQALPFLAQIADTPRDQWNTLCCDVGLQAQFHGTALQPQPIHCFWGEGHLNETAQLSLSSFLRLGHRVTLHTYSPGASAQPRENLMVVDAATTLERALYVTAVKNAGVQFFSDLFRYAALYRSGGWWLDLDVVLRKPLRLASPFVLSTQYRGEPIVGNVLKAPKSSSHMRELLRLSSDALQRGNTRFGEAGPRLLTRYVFSPSGAALQKYIVPPVYFNAINWDEIEYLRQPSALADLILSDERVHGVHLWNKMWHDAGLQLRDSHAESVVGRMLTIHRTEASQHHALP